MPYFTAAHVSHALHYLPDQTHPSLISFLGMLKAELPISQAPLRVFGSTQETELLQDYFRPEGGPPDRPWYVPFGAPRDRATNWKPRKYAGTSLQRMRTGKRFIYLQGDGARNDLWSFHPDFIAILEARGPEVIGLLPISVHNLAAWCYRLEDVPSHQGAIDRFVDEFRLDAYNLVGVAFDATPDPALANVPLAPQPVPADQLFALLQPPPAPRGAPPAAVAAPDPAIPVAAEDVEEEADYSWEVDGPELRIALGELRGMEEAAFRALAALRAGMHVIFTGPPGTGKTQLARRLCAATDIPFSMAAATDQWTTVDTIGGYFPSASRAGHLDFLPGFVVNAMMGNHALIIDEINRADIDKAFGELFTLLSGNDVDLPYLMRDNNGEDEGISRRIRLAASAAADDPTTVTIRLPVWWRLIGSMNDADKASLKRLSYAFVRRFAFIPVNIPPSDVYNQLLEAGAGNGADGLAATRPDYLAALKALFADQSGLASIDMAMGYAIPEAMMRQARSEIALDADRTTASLLVSSLDLYVAPQFQGRADKHDDLLKLAAKHLNAATVEEFARRLAIWTGFVE